MTIPIVAALALFSIFRYPTERRVYGSIADLLPHTLTE
jgi:hypothetical protein